ncbi:hypothetical protein P9139_14745 [Curtobacterium flaccumfaciens]|nr:hypothetical protein P9139_14745 [Curtobacterium flaccumfaciens]
MRTIPALLVTIGLAAALTGCAASGAGTTPSSCAAPGAASEAVTATGSFGKEPKVDIPSGLTTKGTQVSVLKHGAGREIEDGTPVLIEYTLVDGATGKVAQTSGYSGRPRRSPPARTTTARSGVARVRARRGPPGRRTAEERAELLDHGRHRNVLEEDRGRRRRRDRRQARLRLPRDRHAAARR